MIKNNHTAKTSHNENFDFLIGELVQKQVSELVSDLVERINLIESLQSTKEILTVKEVANLLSLNERVVREKINFGFIPAYKPPFSNKLYILKSELISEIMSGLRFKSLTLINEEIDVQSNFSNVQHKKCCDD